MGALCLLQLTRSTIVQYFTCFGLSYIELYYSTIEIRIWCIHLHISVLYYSFLKKLYLIMIYSHILIYIHAYVLTSQYPFHLRLVFLECTLFLVP